VIDSHCHLDRCEQPDQAIDQTLTAMVTVGTDLARSRLAVSTAASNPNVFAAVGVHPNDAAAAAQPYVRAGIEQLAAHPLVVAIGETGFDRYWDSQTPAAQMAAFEWQADLARRSGKPLILHVRDKQGSSLANDEAAAAILNAGHGQGVLHCFNGNPRLLEAGLQLGWMVSFAGNLTYKSAGNLRELAAQVPLERLLVETDAPYLAPVPKRGQRNVPAWVRYTAATLAEVRGVPLTELEPVLDANAQRLFGLTQARAAFTQRQAEAAAHE
jgi:TatD DNase family protein